MEAPPKRKRCEGKGYPVETIDAGTSQTRRRFNSGHEASGSEPFSPCAWSQVNHVARKKHHGVSLVNMQKLPEVNLLTQLPKISVDTPFSW